MSKPPIEFLIGGWFAQLSPAWARPLFLRESGSHKTRSLTPLSSYVLGVLLVRLVVGPFTPSWVVSLRRQVPLGIVHPAVEQSLVVGHRRVLAEPEPDPAVEPGVQHYLLAEDSLPHGWKYELVQTNLVW